MISHKKTLSEKISELINPNPVWDDPENEYSETTAKVVENNTEYTDNENVPRSTLKLSQSALLDEEDNKYVGKKVSRRSYEKESCNTSTFSEEIDVDFTSEDESAPSEELSAGTASDDSESDSECEDDGSIYGSSHEEDLKSHDTNQEQQNEKYLLKDIISGNFPAELEKANAVRSQIRLWDNLLEARIQLQKCLVAANKLPRYAAFDTFKHLGGSDFQMQASRCKEEGLGFLEKLMDLQQKLMQSNSEIRKCCSGKPMNGDTDDVESSEEGSALSDVKDSNDIPKKRRKLSEISKEITLNHNDFKKYRNDTLEKWYFRSKVVNTKSSNFSAFDLSVLKQIEHVMCDKDNLIKRTQKKRSCYRLLGDALSMETEKDQEPKAEDEFDREIYDDDDFYHKLLRELIERKTADVGDTVQLGRQWTELQKLRQKLKKKVDTKASKGRKIRYVVHPKLVNYMAPIPNSWSDSAMDDLYRSLFGKAE